MIGREDDAGVGAPVDRVEWATHEAGTTSDSGADSLPFLSRPPQPSSSNSFERIR
jgi:hypothetical protein